VTLTLSEKSLKLQNALQHVRHISLKLGETIAQMSFKSDESDNTDELYERLLQIISNFEKLMYDVSVEPKPTGKRPNPFNSTNPTSKRRKRSGNTTTTTTTTTATTTTTTTTTTSTTTTTTTTTPQYPTFATTTNTTDDTNNNNNNNNSNNNNNDDGIATFGYDDFCSKLNLEFVQEPMNDKIYMPFNLE